MAGWTTSASSECCALMWNTDRPVSSVIHGSLNSYWKSRNDFRYNWVEVDMKVSQSVARVFYSFRNAEYPP